MRVQIKSAMDLTEEEEEAGMEDVHEVFCYTSQYGDSEYYATVEEAYINAVEYLECPLP